MYLENNILAKNRNQSWFKVKALDTKMTTKTQYPYGGRREQTPSCSLTPTLWHLANMHTHE